jgi:predicted nucleic acid-binding protein
MSNAMHIFFDANICLDLLDTKRITSKASVAWYLEQKDKKEYKFLYSADFITTIFYILTQRRKVSADKVLNALDTLSLEVLPYYLEHSDYTLAKESFFNGLSEDLEDLMVLSSALRAKCHIFLTNDKELLKLKEFQGMKIEAP